MNDQNPQLEDGYVKIANEIFDQLCWFRIPGELRLIVDAIIRKTYGWNKKEDWISQSQLVTSTRLLKGNVSRSLSKLITHKIVIKSDNKLKLNKKLNEWVGFSKLSKLITKKKLSEMISPVIKTDKKVIRSEGNKIHYTKDTITKDKYQAVPRDIKSLRAEANRIIGGISTPWQDKAFRIAETLKIELKNPSLKGRWLKFFKDNQNGKVDMAVSYLVDYPPFTILDEDEHRVKYFFAYYYNKLKST